MRSARFAPNDGPGLWSRVAWRQLGARAVRRCQQLDAEGEQRAVLLDETQRWVSYQVPGEQFVHSGRVYEKDGTVARWRGIHDDRGRVIVAICHNMDLGDSWEHADNPYYPQKFSQLGLRIGVDYIAYAMTH